MPVKMLPCLGASCRGQPGGEKTRVVHIGSVFQLHTSIITTSVVRDN